MVDHWSPLDAAASGTSQLTRLLEKAAQAPAKLSTNQAPVDQGPGFF